MHPIGETLDVLPLHLGYFRLVVELALKVSAILLKFDDVILGILHVLIYPMVILRALQQFVEAVIISLAVDDVVL